MFSEDAVAQHYANVTLLESIQDGIEQLGKSVESMTIREFAPIDEFHIGGIEATEHLMAQLGLTADTHVLDIGCGLGGPARFVAEKYGSRVTGIDLTDDYVKTGETINQWVGLGEQISLQQGSALKLPFAPESFDGGYMIHVGMNIGDKPALFRGIHRVLRSGATFGVFDVMKTADGEITYPVPWASVETLSALTRPREYEEALSNAGFEIVTINNRRDFALETFEALRSKLAGNSALPPLGLHILMEASAPSKVKNMVENVMAGLIAPMEIIVRKV